MSTEEAPLARDELAVIARRIRFVYLAILFAVLALVCGLLFFLREIFLAVSTPRHVPR